MLAYPHNYRRMKDELKAPIGRRRFLASSGAAVVSAAALPAIPATAQTAPPAVATPTGSGGAALVLTGGAARGAYQAGVILGLCDKLGLDDGQPLPYDMVAGTSIGSLNGYFVATAQYSKLEHLWNTISSANVLRLKPQYAKVPQAQAGVVTRISQALGLALGLGQNVLGVLDRQPFHEVMLANVDPAVQPHIPLYWTATNITYRRGDLFHRPATSALGKPRQARVDAALAARPGRIPRMIPDNLLIDGLMASATIPLAFDPMPIPDAINPALIDFYVDGGVTNNAAVGIAQRCTSLVQGIMVDPPTAGERFEYTDGIGLAMGIFETMQWSIVRYATLLAFAESAIVSGVKVANTKDSFDGESIPLRLEVIRPKSELPGKTADFNDHEAIVKSLAIGRADAAGGWAPLTLEALTTYESTGRYPR